MHPKFTLDQSGFASDERGVTPVISVVLVIALTMVVAALVGSNALALANHSSEVAPNVGIHTDWTGSNVLVVEHQSGSAVEMARLTIVVDGELVYDGGLAQNGATVDAPADGVLAAGDTIEITGASDFGDRSFTIYYEGNDKSFVLAEN